MIKTPYFQIKRLHKTIFNLVPTEYIGEKKHVALCDKRKCSILKGISVICIILVEHYPPKKYKIMYDL